MESLSRLSGIQTVDPDTRDKIVENWMILSRLSGLALVRDGRGMEAAHRDLDPWPDKPKSPKQTHPAGDVNKIRSSFHQRKRRFLHGEAPLGVNLTA